MTYNSPTPSVKVKSRRRGKNPFFMLPLPPPPSDDGLQLMSPPPKGGDSGATVAIAVCYDRRSRRAVRWAVEHLVGGAYRMVLLHVIPAVSSVPSPNGGRIPIDKVDREVAAMYIQDLKSKAEQVFFPFRKLCGKREVETLVLEGNDRVSALLKYVSDSGTKKLVLGSSSNWFRRILKGSDVPTDVLKLSPSSCNVYVVSRHKVTMRLVNQSVSDTDVSPKIEVISHRTFIQSCTSSILDEQESVCSLSSESTRTMQRIDFGSQSQTMRRSSETALLLPNIFEGEALPNIDVTEEGKSENGTLQVQTWRKYDAIASLKDIPFLILQPKAEVKDEPSAEVLNLRMELQRALVVYRKACEDLVVAKKKVQLLSVECSEETEKVKNALKIEKMLKRVASDERKRHLEAVKDLEEAKQLLEKEILNKNKAETSANKVSSEKAQVINALFTNDKRCRRYSKKEIELATDNFSKANKIGEGSYGNVYKCILDHTSVAVKVPRQEASYKKDEYLKEVEILSQIRHPNIVMLLGVCPETGTLVYEHMDNGSLEDQLFSRDIKKPLSWFLRFKIVFEVARGLAFLHGFKPEPIVHRDLKPGNILLDSNNASKIGDVGLSKVISDVVPDGHTEYKETLLAGTFYYMDPEYQRTGTLRPKSDLYAFGIITLQLLTRKHPNGLIGKVESSMNGGYFSDVLDKSVSDWPLVEAERLAKLALKCCRLKCRDRPDLESEVLPELEELMTMANICLKLERFNICAPSHFICPILQEVMEEPYVASDGYTYEYIAIKTWLQKYKISPVTKLKLPHTTIIPSHSLYSAIQKWKSEVGSSTI